MPRRGHGDTVNPVGTRGHWPFCCPTRSSLLTGPPVPPLRPRWASSPTLRPRHSWAFQRAGDTGRCGQVLPAIVALWLSANEGLPALRGLQGTEAPVWAWPLPGPRLLPGQRAAKETPPPGLRVMAGCRQTAGCRQMVGCWWMAGCRRMAGCGLIAGCRQTAGCRQMVGCRRMAGCRQKRLAPQPSSARQRWPRPASCRCLV